MRFSIIIPVYNAEKYIEDCLQSILYSNWNEYEIILVDDGSLDRSGEICDTFQKKYPDIIKVIHQSNQGQLISRCNGVKSSSGDYCIFLDVDDYIVPETYDKLMEIIEKYEFPDMVIYSFYYEYGKDYLQKSEPLFSGERLFSKENKQKLLECFFYSTKLNNVWTKAVKRTVLSGNYPDYSKYWDLRCSEDRLYSMGLVSNSDRIVYTDEPLYIYKIIPGSITRQYSYDRIPQFNTIKLYEMEKQYLIKWGMYNNEFLYRLQANYLNQAMYVFLKFYENMSDKKDRKLLFKYDWQKFVKSEFIEKIDDNIYVNSMYYKMWKVIVNKNQVMLKMLIYKKKIYEAIRSIKRKIII